MVVLQSHMFLAKFSTIIFWKNYYDFHCFLILYYNKFPEVCGLRPKKIEKENYYNKLHVVICVTLGTAW